VAEEMDFGSTSSVKDAYLANALIVTGWISSGFTMEHPVLGPLGAALCLFFIGVMLWYSRFSKSFLDAGRLLYGFESPGSHIRLRYYHLFPFFLFLPSKLATVSRDFARLKYSVEIKRQKNNEKTKERYEEAQKSSESLKANNIELDDLSARLHKAERKNIRLKDSLDISINQKRNMGWNYRQFIIDSMTISIDQGVDIDAYKALVSRSGGPFSELEWHQIISDCKNKKLKQSVITILHADDCRDERRTLSHYIEKINNENGWNFHLEQANDGEKALEIFNKKHPNLVITDQMMGSEEKDGNTFAKKIREKSPHIPIIVRSGSSQKDLTELFSGLSVMFVQKNTSYPRFVYAIELTAKKIIGLNG